MKKFLFLFFLVPFLSSCQISIDTPSNYSKMNYDEKGVIYAVEKINNGIILSNFILKENDDWSFSHFTNEEYINTQIKSDEYESALKVLYQDCNIIMKKDFFFKSVGDVFMIVFSYEQDGIELVNTIFQFIKNKKLYTATGSSVRNNYRESFNEYVSMLESIKI